MCAHSLSFHMFLVCTGLYKGSWRVEQSQCLHMGSNDWGMSVIWLRYEYQVLSFVFGEDKLLHVHHSISDLNIQDLILLHNLLNERTYHYFTMYWFENSNFYAWRWAKVPIFWDLRTGDWILPQYAGQSLVCYTYVHWFIFLQISHQRFESIDSLHTSIH